MRRLPAARLFRAIGNESRVYKRSADPGRIQLIVATRSLLGYRATPETDPALPHCDTRRVHFDRRVSPEARDLASLFSTIWWPNLDKHSAVLGLVQDEPALRPVIAKCCDDHLSPGSLQRSVIGAVDGVQRCDDAEVERRLRNRLAVKYRGRGLVPLANEG